MPADSAPISNDSSHNDHSISTTFDGETIRQANPVPPAVPALHTQVTTLSDQLAEARQALDDTNRRAAIDLELARANTIDLETTRLLIEHALRAHATPDIPLAVADLRKRKPFLFRRADAASAMGPHAPHAPPHADAAADLARRAMETGDRRALLGYLKERRRR